MESLKSLGEFEVIRRLLERRPSGPGVVVGGGDDAAVLAVDPSCELVATTDALVEGRHYRDELVTPHELGARLAAANLSDVAAMGGRARWALLSAGIRSDRPFETVSEVESGLCLALSREGAALVGGNFSAVDGPEWWSLTVLGEVTRGQAWKRSGAKPGDQVIVTGFPGRAAAGLAFATRHGAPRSGDWWRPLFTAWVAPAPPLALVRGMRSPLIAAAIDISDGLAADLGQLCAASGVGAEIDPALLPADPLLERGARELDVPLESLRFSASDDYQLLLAVRPTDRAAVESAARKTGVVVHVIGRTTAEPGLRLIGGGEARPIVAGGWDHFK
jgi:thiamine-monophosphate kinase